jgi:hypothetical protein
MDNTTPTNKKKQPTNQPDLTGPDMPVYLPINHRREGQEEDLILGRRHTKNTKNTPKKKHGRMRIERSTKKTQTTNQPTNR